MHKVLIALLALLVGAVLGAGVMNQWLMPQLTELSEALIDQERTLTALQEKGDNGERLARLESERVQYEATLAQLRKELDAAKTTEPVPVENTVAEFETPATDSDADIDAAIAPESDRRGDRGRRGGSWGGEGTQEEQEARRREFVTQMQNNLTDFFTGELEKSNTPEMQERLVALETQVNEMMEIRRQMRGVESDEERDALRQAFGETMDGARNIMKEQQQDMIDAIAGQFNISSPADRAAFQQAVQAAVDSPFFQENPASLLWSTGGGGYSGGYGGRPSRGGGPPR